MDKFIENIKKQKTECVFISPHLDDAVLSSGALMLTLSKLTKVTVISVFTNANGSNSLSARVALSKSHSKNSTEYIRVRKNEDIKTLDKMNIGHIHLGYADALWREKKNNSQISKVLRKIIPEFGNLYPTYKFHIQNGKVALEDKKTIDNITKKLTKIKKEVYIFCPLAIGNHVDHQIVFEASKKIKRSVIYWADIPYVGKFKKAGPKDYESFSFSKNLKEKEKYVKMYKSQFNLIFKNGKFPRISETYYIPKSFNN